MDIRWLWRIPGLVPGILFFLPWLATAASLELARDLGAEGDWAGCWRECRRVLQVEPGDAAAAQLGALARFRMDPRDAQRRQALAQNLAGGLVGGVGPWAAYALAADAARRGEANEAFDWGVVAFAQADSHDFFLRSGCLLDALARRYPERMASHDALRLQLQTCRSLWSRELQAEAKRMIRSGDGPWAQPGRWIVIFYRGQISPALGARCSLTPSCSEYFLQACRQAGMLGFPIAADRLIREPSVIAVGAHPVGVGRNVRYADPLSDHLGGRPCVAPPAGGTRL